MPNLTIHVNNTVSLNNMYVGRIDRDSYSTRTGQKGVTTFFTASGDPRVTGYNIPHKISAPLYIGGPADWRINPDFVAQISAIAN